VGRRLFIYPNGRVSALEPQLLDRRMWGMLLSADDRDEALRLLGDTWYSRFMEHRSLEGAFERAMQATEDELLELSEDPRLVRGIMHRRDVRNARYLWKAHMLDADPDQVEVEASGLVDIDLLRRALESEEAREELPDLFAGAAEELLELSSPQASEVDAVLDRLAARVETDELPELGDSFRVFVRTHIETQNFLTAGRASVRDVPAERVEAMLAPGGYHTPEEIAGAYRRGRLADALAGTTGLEELAETLEECLDRGSFQTYERKTDAEMLDMLDRSSFAAFGPESLAAFVVKRELEIRHLRILIAGKTAGMDRRRLLRRIPRG
jgi:V/A-type H+-transporting ATPase subunit C